MTKPTTKPLTNQRPGPPTGDGDDATTRARLLDAARALLLERGFAGVTTRAIADRAEVNNALVHYHFGTKAALLAEAALVSLADDLGAVAGLLHDAPTLGSSVASVVEWAHQLDLDDPRVGLLAELMVEAFRDPRIRPVVADALTAARRELAGALARHRELDDDLVEPLAGLLGALIDGLVLHRLVDTELDVASWAAAAATLLDRRGTARGHDAGAVTP